MVEQIIEELKDLVEWAQRDLSSFDEMVWCCGLEGARDNMIYLIEKYSNQVYLNTFYGETFVSPEERAEEWSYTNK